MNKLCIVGAFTNGVNTSDGQSVKTRNLSAELQKKMGTDNVISIDTQAGKLKVMLQVIALYFRCDSIIMLPAQNGLKVFTPLLYFFNKVAKRNLMYSVIGGWLPSMLETAEGLKSKLMSFDLILVETNTMKTKLEALGFTNITVMPNFKNLHVLEKSDLIISEAKPLKLITFSRVMKKKGIEDAINVVRRINNECSQAIYHLDIYGSVDPNETEWFDEIKASLPEYIKYRGVANPQDSVEIIKSYFALLFPTKFFTEGIPGTIIDAYAAGVPVVSAKWESFADVVDDGVTGIGYEFENVDDLYNVLNEAKDTPEMLNNLKENCLRKAYEFMPEYAMSKLKM